MRGSLRRALVVRDSLHVSQQRCVAPLGAWMVVCTLLHHPRPGNANVLPPRLWLTACVSYSHRARAMIWRRIQQYHVDVSRRDVRSVGLKHACNACRWVAGAVAARAAGMPRGAVRILRIVEYAVSVHTVELPEPQYLDLPSNHSRVGVTRRDHPRQLTAAQGSAGANLRGDRAAIHHGKDEVVRVVESKVHIDKQTKRL